MNRYVSVDATQCIGCRTCEIACAMAHKDGSEALTSENFLPRLTVVRRGAITAPLLCRHCDDAACVKACPAHAIVFTDDTVRILEDRCLGCKTCVAACPYEAIRMIQIPAESMPGTFVAHRMKSVAHKCDLCPEQAAGPACIPVCPTKALKLVDRNELAAASRKR